MHIGSWITGFVALTVSVVLLIGYRRKKKWNWATAGGIALVLAVAALFNGWRIWPDQTKQHFISVVFHGQHDQVQAMLVEPSQWTFSEDSSLVVLASDGTKVTLALDELPLSAAIGEGGGVPVPNRGVDEVIAAREDFTIGTITKRTCIIHCTAEQGRVRIRHVEVTGGHN